MKSVNEEQTIPEWEVEVLKYGSKEMKVDPVGMSLSDVAKHVMLGDSVAVILEPGDSTRYTILISPLWGCVGDLRHFGIPTAGRYLLVVKLHDQGGVAFYAHERVMPFELRAGGISNEWTALFLTWWLRKLWYEIDWLCSQSD